MTRLPARSLVSTTIEEISVLSCAPEGWISDTVDTPPAPPEGVEQAESRQRIAGRMRAMGLNRIASFTATW